MDKKLQQILKAINIQKATVESVREKYEKEFEILNDLEDSLDEYRLKHGMFYPIEMLKDFASEDSDTVFIVVCVAKEENGKLSLLEFGPAEIIKILENGKIYVSDYERGIVKWDDKLNRYVRWYCCKEEVFPEIVGFYKIEYYENTGKYDIEPPNVKTAKI